MKDVAVIILAAGKGKRMKSDLAKVLHRVLGRPMIEHLLNTLITLNVKKIVIVVGYQADRVKDALLKFNDKADFVLQEKQLGTGHAVMVTEEKIKGFSGDILVLAGDVPFLSAETIQKLIEVHRREKAAATVLSSIPTDASGYGRIVRIPATDLVDKIVEHEDATEEEKKIGEINTGTFCFDSKYLFEALREVKADNIQKEYYLTDVMEVLKNEGHKTAVYLTDNADEALGVNSFEQLADLETRLAKKLGLNEASAR
jgi:UDP-N-acetylglucosamine diphosphorylase/glucosamine-1-phosphate N-acetyltransferase